MLATKQIVSRPLRSAALPFRASRPARLVSVSARPQQQADEAAPSPSSSVTSALLSIAAASWAAPALAADGEYGSLLEGRFIALVHPAVMFFLFGATIYAGVLGWNWRRARELGDEVRALKKNLPAPAADGTAVMSPIAAEIEQKEKERKDLLADSPRDKHWWWGSLLLASGTGLAIEGCVNTFMRTGKLFPGPHLFAGAGIVGLWAMAAALVPAMQKGDNNARNAHIALNVANLALFTWQVPTGLEIVGKVFEFVPKWF